MDLDKNNSITQWSYENKTDMGKLDGYKNFRDLVNDALSPLQQKKLRFHLMYYVSNKICHKTSLVVDGHLTD